MAKPKKPDSGVKIADNILTDLEANEVFDPELAAIEQVIRQYGDTGGRVTIYKQGPGGYRDITYLFACPPSEWLEDGPSRLQRDYGKGIYRIHIQDASGAFIVNKAIPVEALPQSRVAAPVAIQAQETPVAVALEMMAKSIAGMMEAVKFAVQPNPGGNLAQLKELAQVVKEIMPAPAPASPASTGNNFEQTLSAATSIMGMLDRFSRPREKELPVDGDGNTDVGSAAMMKGLNLLEDILKRGMAQQSAAPGAEQAVSAPNAVLEAKPELEREPEVDELELAALKVQVLLANKAARAGESPQSFADEKYESIPDDILETLAFDPKWFEYLCTQVPECIQLQLWWQKVREHMMELGIMDGLFVRNPDGTLRAAELTDAGQTVTVAGNGDTVAGPTDGNSGSTH